MGSAPQQYAAIVGMDTYAVDNLFDERFARPRGTSGNTLNFVSQYLTEHHRTRSLVQVFDNHRITITDHDRLLDLAGKSYGLPEQQRAIVIQASGPHLDQLGPTIVHAAGLEPEQVIPFESLAYIGSLPSAGEAGYVPPERVGLLIALARWRAMLVKPPLFIAHAASEQDVDVAENLFRSAVPPFVRDYTMSFIITSHARDSINGLLNLSPDGESDGHETFLARQCAVILAGAEDAYRDDIVALGKTPLAKGRADSRRLSRALSEAMGRVPDVAGMTPLAPAAPSRTDDDVAGTAQALEALTRQLETERGRLRSANETITALRRELRAAHHALDAAPGAPITAGPAPRPTPEPEVTGPVPPALVAPDLLGKSPTTFAEVFDLAREHLPHIVLPEKVDAQVAELTGTTKTGLWAGRTWMILATLEAYAQARTLGGSAVTNLRTYMSSLAHPPFAPNQVSTRESNAVENNTRMRTQRTFAVPTEVNPDGWQYMSAHVRVDPSGKMPAPRLHFYDDSTGTTGRIYVGYIGPHLTNFRTT